jgi:DnaJ-class molecular chaperone
VTAFIINANNEELDPVGATSENVRGKGRSTLDRHLLLASELEQRHFCSKCSGKGLGMADKTSRGQGEIVANLEQLLNAFVSNEVTHSGSMIGPDDNTAVEGDAECACSSFHYGWLVLHLHQSLLYADTS